jgi:hypothetical protein
VTYRGQQEIVMENNGSTFLNQALALFYGSARAPLAYITPDQKHPGIMWRVVLPDGHTSGMVNLTRAKDMAMSIVERGPPRRDFKLLRWRYDHLEKPSAGRWCVPAQTPYSEISAATRPTAEETGPVPGTGPRRQVA